MLFQSTEREDVAAARRMADRCEVLQLNCVPQELGELADGLRLSSVL